MRVSPPGDAAIALPGSLPPATQIGLERREGDDVLEASRRPLRRHDVLKGRHRHTVGSNLDRRSADAEACMAIGESRGYETKIEGSMLGEQRHGLNLTQQTGIGIERDALGIPFDPETDLEVPKRRGEVDQVHIVG